MLAKSVFLALSDVSLSDVPVVLLKSAFIA